MKKLTRRRLNDLILEELRLFLEGDDEGTDLFGGGEEDEAADEGGDEEEAADDTDEDTEGDTEEGEESDEEAEDSDPKIQEPDLSELPAEERADLTKAIDDELNSLFMDFEASALQSAAVEKETAMEIASESYSQRLKRYLFEGEDETGPKIDIHQFANDTARLINHYQDLIDMEKMIFNKAKVFLMAKYSNADVDEFEEILYTDHGIDFGKDKEHPEPFGDEKGMPETPWPPRAIGAAPPAA